MHLPMSYVEAELRWALKRPESRANKEKIHLDEVTIDTPDAFELALNSLETTFLATYRRLFPPTNGKPVSYSLAHNPESGFGLVAVGGDNLHTLIKNAHLLWCDSPGLPNGREGGRRVRRWLTPRELLLVQAFPVTRGGNHHELCSFNSSRERKRSAITQQAGNSMTVPCVGAMELFAACVCSQRVGSKQPSLGDMLRRKIKRH